MAIMMLILKFWPLQMFVVSLAGSQELVIYLVLWVLICDISVLLCIAVSRILVSTCDKVDP